MARLYAAVLLCMSFACAAAERPRICVVLSGGGARGAAHIGVLKVLEEYRVPIHLQTSGSLGDGSETAKETSIIKIDGTLSVVRDPGE